MDKRQELIESFRDRDTREGYAEGFLQTWIASQLAAVRQQRGLTQKALAEAIGTKQPGIARMERDDYGKWNLQTLARAAAALDCRLKVSLETYGSLIEEIVAFTSPEYLLRLDFAHDPVIAPQFAFWPEMNAPGPVGYVRRAVTEWLARDAPVDQLAVWLSNPNLALAGDELPPSYWLIRALDGAPESVDRIVNERLRSLSIDLRRRPERFARADFELLSLIRQRPCASEFEPVLLQVYDRLREKWGSNWSAENPGVEALLLALAENQTTTGAARRVWRNCIDRATADRPASADLGLYGYAATPQRPNSREVIETGLEDLFQRFLKLGRDYSKFVVGRLEELVRRIGDERFAELLGRSAVELNIRQANMSAIELFVVVAGHTGLPTTFAEAEFAWSLAACA